MGTNTLAARSTGETITSSFFNDFNTALSEDMVGRNAAGAATSGQNLGTSSVPWGTLYSDNIILDGSALDVSSLTSPANRIVSGKTRTTSNQPNFLVANGSAASLVIDGTPTNLVVDINGSTVTVNTDITVSGLTAAPSSNNTCAVNDADAADQESTRYWGEPLNDYLPWVGWDIASTAVNDMAHKETITVDAMGSEISNLIGKLAAFKINDGSNDEYFIAYVKSATELTNCFRGCFLDNAGLPVNRIKFANNDVITLMKLTWVFITNDGTTADVSYSNPIWSYDEPGSPTTGDYWYKLGESKWYRYSGSAFVSIDRTLLGVSIQNTSNCVATRSLDFYYDRKDIDTLTTERKDATIVRGGNLNANVYVYSKLHNFNLSIIDWNITTDLAPTASKDSYLAETASTLYYLYITDDGDVIMSDIGPTQRADLLGPYHPHNPWRCVGFTFNDASSNLINTTAPIKNEKLSRLNSAYQFSLTPAAGNPSGAIFPSGSTSVPTGYLYCDGSAVSRTTYSALFTAIGENYGQGDNVNTFNLPDFRGYFLRGQDDGSSHDTDDAGRTALATGGNTGDNIGSFQDDGTAVNNLSGSTNTTGAHTHTLTRYPTSSGYGADVSGGHLNTSTATTSSNGSHSHTVSLSSSDNETRPKNVYVRYYIKF
jgi:microcystin-dependent protein